MGLALSTPDITVRAQSGRSAGSLENKKTLTLNLASCAFVRSHLKSARSYFLCGFLKWWPRDAKGAPSVSFRGFFILLYRGHLCLEGGSLLGLLSSPRMGLS